MGKPDMDSETSDDKMKDFSSSTKIVSLSIDDYHEDDRYEPFQHRDKKNANSDFGALAHLIKSSLGTGILAMPNALKHGGLYFGGIGTIIIGIICAHCVHILVRTSHVLSKRTRTPKMTYAETAYAAFLCGPESLKPLANTSKIFVNTALCATYVGGACVYIVFIATSIQQIVEYNTKLEIDVRLLMAALVPAVVLLGQVRNLKYMVPFSIIANASMMIGFCGTLYYIFINIKPVSSVEGVAKVTEIPIFLSTVVFAMEGIGVVMPVENNMQKPQHFLGCPGVLNITMTIVVSLYAVMGIFGYLAYGSKTEPIVTLNIPLDEVLGQVVKMLIATAVLFTYGLQFFVPLEIISKGIKATVSHKYQMISDTTVRILLVLFTVVMAVVVTHLEAFISLVGAIFFSVLGISIPAVIETVSCWEYHLGAYNWRLWKNLLLIAFSMVALISGSWISITEIISQYSAT